MFLLFPRVVGVRQSIPTTDITDVEVINNSAFEFNIKSFDGSLTHDIKNSDAPFSEIITTNATIVSLLHKSVIRTCQCIKTYVGRFSWKFKWKISSHVILPHHGPLLHQWCLKPRNSYPKWGENRTWIGNSKKKQRKMAMKFNEIIEKKNGKNRSIQSKYR